MGAPYGLFKLVPSKSRRHDNPIGTEIAVPVSKVLRDLLDEMRSERSHLDPGDYVSTTILVNAVGRPWSGNSFRKAWAHVAQKAGIGRAIAKAAGSDESDRTFNDLRGTAITRLAVNGCPNAMIAKITGWSSRYVSDILDKYLARTDKLAVAAFAYMEKTKAGTRGVN
jgi:integrase